MLKKDTVRKLENKIKKYYFNKKQIESKLKLISKLEDKIHIIKNNIDETNITIDDGIKGICYESDRVQSSTGRGPIEGSFDAALNELEKELKTSMAKLILKELEVRDLELDIAEIDSILVLLSDEQMEIVDLLYNKKIPVKQVENILHTSETTLWRRKQEILEIIAAFEF